MLAFLKDACLSVGFGPSIVICAIVTSNLNYCESANCLEAAASSACDPGRLLCFALLGCGLEEQQVLRDAANRCEAACQM